MVAVTEAPLAFRLLNGIICVYKPSLMSKFYVRNIILGNLSKDLCDLKCRPPENHVFIEGDPSKSLSVTVGPSYADMPEVVGPRYQPRDIKCHWATHTGSKTSGVFVLGVGTEGVKSAIRFDAGRPLRVYHVSGRLGLATEDCMVSPFSRIVEKATYKTVRRTGIDRILASVQATHQRQVFHQIGVDPQSQAAYDLAVQGPIRPASRKIPVIYGLKCIEFNPPDFTVEVHCINETEEFLARMMLDVALKHHTVAACTGIRCVRHGPFSFQDALLRKHWRLEHILNSIPKFKQLLEQVDQVTPQLKPLMEQPKVTSAI